MKLRPWIPLIFIPFVLAWSNGPAGNATTNLTSECEDPPYATHDWVADHALDFLPAPEKAWLEPHKRLYLLGTEAPDNDDIPLGCGAPHTGYDDRFLGHSVEWNEDWSAMIVDRAAVRAREEYFKAIAAYQIGDEASAAFYLGAMAHYIGDCSQYGHTTPNEEHHSDYENWVKTRTDSPAEGSFESFLVADNLVRRTPYTAVKRLSKALCQGKGEIESAVWMDSMYDQKNESEKYFSSIGQSLDFGANELADVLHTFYLNIVSEE